MLCTFPACTGEQVAKRLCDGHYRQQRRGTALTPLGTIPRGRRSRSVAERFWESVSKGESCWLWVGSGTLGGYGQLAAEDSTTKLYVHRYSWELHFGPIPPGLQVLHRCDVRRCVRPDHLFVGTQLDNIRDMWAKGRARPVRGAQTGRSDFVEADIHAIRQRRMHGETCTSIARSFGVSTASISKIVLLQRWAHVVTS